MNIEPIFVSLLYNYITYNGEYRAHNNNNRVSFSSESDRAETYAVINPGSPPTPQQLPYLTTITADGRFTGFSLCFTIAITGGFTVNVPPNTYIEVTVFTANDIMSPLLPTAYSFQVPLPAGPLTNTTRNYTTFTTPNNIEPLTVLRNSIIVPAFRGINDPTNSAPELAIYLSWTGVVKH